MGIKNMNPFRLVRFSLLLATLFGYAGCSHAPAQPALPAHTSTASPPEAQAVDVEPQPSVDELLAQIAPPESCLNTLKNIRFALDTGLFNRPEFHTDENMRRFFGQWYHQEEGMYKTPDLIVDTDYYRSNQRKYPWVPCFATIHLSGMHKLPTGKYVDNIKGGIFFKGEPVRSFSFYDRLNNIKFDDFLDSLGLTRLTPAQDCNDAFSPNEIHLVRNVYYLRETIDRLQKDMASHVYGECILRYRFNTDHFDVYIIAITYRDGSIAQLEIQTEKRGK